MLNILLSLIFLSKAAIIAVIEDLIKEINSLIYRFIWKGKDKIKRAALINDIEDGSLKMLDIQSMLFAQMVMVLKRFANRENKGSWKITLNYFLSKRVCVKPWSQVKPSNQGWLPELIPVSVA